MQLLKTNGIDIQVPKEEETDSLYYAGTKIFETTPEPYDKERTEELIGDYLQYYVYELRDQKTCEYLYKEIKWFLDEYYMGHNVLQVYLAHLNTIIVRVELWKDKESFEYYLTHLMDRDRPEIYSVIGFFMENDHSVMPFNRNGYYPNGKPAVKGQLTIG